jgi:hypothetical protein
MITYDNNNPMKKTEKKYKYKIDVTEKRCWDFTSRKWRDVVIKEDDESMTYTWESIKK